MYTQPINTLYSSFMGMLTEYIVKVHYCMRCVYFKMNEFVPAVNVTVNRLPTKLYLMESFIKELSITGQQDLF